MAADEQDQKFIEDVVKAIVDYPADVKTERTIDERGVLIKLYVNQEDMGKIIGKEGKTAKAIRTLLRVFGAKNDARLNLKIVEPEGSERPERVERTERVERSEESKEPEKKESDESESSDKDKDDVMADIPNDVLA